jgi:hypothetical protein
VFRRPVLRFCHLARVFRPPATNSNRVPGNNFRPARVSRRLPIMTNRLPSASNRVTTSSNRLPSRSNRVTTQWNRLPGLNYRLPRVFRDLPSASNGAQRHRPRGVQPTGVVPARASNRAKQTAVPSCVYACPHEVMFLAAAVYAEHRSKARRLAYSSANDAHPHAVTTAEDTLSMRNGILCMNITLPRGKSAHAPIPATRHFSAAVVHWPRPGSKICRPQ